MTKGQLIKGETFSLQTRDEDDLRIAEMAYNPRMQYFTIWFNGAFIFVGGYMTSDFIP